MHIDDILNYKKPNESFYDILGCDQSSSLDQINKEYKIRALQLHPDKNSDPSSLEKFRSLQVAKDVLFDEASRKSYDCWLNSHINIPFEQWNTKKGHSMHWSTPKSTKLGIKGSSSTGQGSELKKNNETMMEHDTSWLQKFRKYEI